LLYRPVVNAFRLRATEPHLPPPPEPDDDWEELADLALRLCERLELLRHRVAVRLAREGRAVAQMLRDGGEIGASRAALLRDVLAFQARARDLLSGSR
jgi:hypothetical protein